MIGSRGGWGAAGPLTVTSRPARPIFNFFKIRSNVLMLQMNSPAQIEGGSSKRNLIIPLQIMSYRQEMFAKLQRHHKSPSKPNFGKKSLPSDIKKICPIQGRPQNCPNPLNSSSQIKIYQKSSSFCRCRKGGRVFES